MHLLSLLEDKRIADPILVYHFPAIALTLWDQAVQVIDHPLSDRIVQLRHRQAGLGHHQKEVFLALRSCLVKMDRSENDPN